MAKLPTDPNQRAHAVLNQFLAGEKTEKNPAAVALGRLGGLKGGKARMDKLTKKQKSELGKKAIAARWAKKSKT